MMRISKFIVNPFLETTYLLTDDATNKAAVVDPGMMNADERAAFDNFIENNNIKLIQVINTHLHIDHCFSDNYVKNKYGVKVAAHIGDAEQGDRLAQQAKMFGLPGAEASVDIDVPLKEGDIIEIGESKLSVIEVPGHTQGGIALYCKEQGFLIAGDSLFEESIGRADLPGGNIWQLVKNIKNKLLTLPKDTLVLPGHGPETTIGHELEYNPHFQ